MRPRFALARVRRKGGLFCPFCGRLPARDGRSEPQGRGRAGRTVRAARRRCGRHREGRPSAAQGNVRDGSRGGAGARRLRPRGISGKQKRPLPAAALRLGSPLCMAEKGAGRLAAVWQDTTAGGRRKNFFCAPPAPYRRADEPVPAPSFVRGGALPFFAPLRRQLPLVGAVGSARLCAPLPLFPKNLCYANLFRTDMRELRPSFAPAGHLSPLMGGGLEERRLLKLSPVPGEPRLPFPFNSSPKKEFPKIAGRNSRFQERGGAAVQVGRFEKNKTPASICER